jgi:HicB family
MMEAAGAPQEPASRGTKRAGSHSGRLLLRMPEALHADLARASERAGVSLNAYITDALAATVGGRRQAPRASAPKARRRFVERLLVVNLVVLSAVGVLAVVLLVQALR